MPETRFVALTLVAVGLLLGLARLLRLPPSVVLFAGGLLSVLLPGPVPALRVDPLVVLGVLLPPLLYAGVSNLSPDVLRLAAWRGVLAGAATTASLVAAVALAALWLIPGMDPVAALAVGVALSIAEPRLLLETGQARRLPRAVSDGLSAQLASAPLIGVSLSLIAAKSVGGPVPPLGEIALTLARDLGLGGAAGVALGLAVAALRRRLENAPAETALSLATPFAAASLGEGLGVSPIAPLIAAGLTVAWRSVDRATGESILSPESRLMQRDFWRALEAILTGALFFLMGRALPEALEGADDLPAPAIAGAVLGLLLLCWAVQFLVSWASLSTREAPPVPREGGGAVPRWQAAALLATGAGRSVIGVAIALALPATLADGSRYADRDVAVAVVALAVIASALLQALALPRLLDAVRPGGEAEAERETARAAAEATSAPLAPADPEDPEGATREGLRRLRALREADAIGDAALQQGEEALALRARAAELGGETEEAPRPPRMTVGTTGQGDQGAGRS